MTTATNPLLDFSDLPRFDLIQPEHVKPAIESLLADGRALIAQLTADNTPATWADFAGALSDGLEGFHPLVAEWFRTRIGTPSAPQREAWPEIAAGRNVLVTAPTGAGKTLAAFLEAIDRLFVAGLSGELPEGVHVLYVSPLKALNNDINRNLERPLSEIRAMCVARGIAFPDIRKAVRTAARRRNAVEALGQIEIEACGKSRVALSGLAEELHRRNVRALYRQIRDEVEDPSTPI